MRAVRYVMVGAACLALLAALPEALAGKCQEGQGDGGKMRKKAQQGPKFEKWDADRNGSVSEAEFLAARTKGKEIKAKREEGIKKQFARLDENQDGALSPEEFGAWCERLKQRHGQAMGGKKKGGEGAPCKEPPAPEAEEPAAEE